MIATAPRLLISAAAPAGVRALVWDVFFASRGRGVHLDVHFPWLGDPAGTHCISLADGDETLAALVIRERDMVGAGRVGLVGLVCVREDRRGQGLSRQLLQAATALARQQGLDDLLLWTGKPEVYAAAGFVADGRDEVVQVTAPECLPGTPFTQQAATVALPPFATSARHCIADGAQLTVLDGAAGPTLAAWSGSEDPLFALIGAVLQRRWTVNLPAGSLLPAGLARHGCHCSSQPGAWRMRLHLGAGPAPALPYTPLLERI